MTLTQQLSKVTAADAKEAEDLRSMREFAQGLKEPFSRTQWPAHFTGSALVTEPRGEKVVLVLHGKLKRWLQPGGHADVADGGSMLESALREAREETGLKISVHATAPQPIDVDVHVIPARKDEPEHRHLDVRFLVVAQNPEALAHDPNESSGAVWLSWDEAIAKADEPALKRLLEKGRAACRGLTV